MNIIKSFVGKVPLLGTRLSLVTNQIAPLSILSIYKKFNYNSTNQTNKHLLNLNNAQISQNREYKTKTRLRKRCKSCYFVWRNGRLYVECNEHPRHKQFHKKSLLKGFDNIPNGYIKGQTII